jgi:hypothetical protein
MIGKWQVGPVHTWEPAAQFRSLSAKTTAAIHTAAFLLNNPRQRIARLTAAAIVRCRDELLTRSRDKQDVPDLDLVDPVIPSKDQSAQSSGN